MKRKLIEKVPYMGAAETVTPDNGVTYGLIGRAGTFEVDGEPHLFFETYATNRSLEEPNYRLVINKKEYASYYPLALKWTSEGLNSSNLVEIWRGGETRDDNYFKLGPNPSWQRVSGPVWVPGEDEISDSESAGGSMESGSGPARSGSGQAVEDVEPGPDHSEHEEPDSEGSLPTEDDNESVLLAPAQLADDESEAGEPAEETEHLSDSMNEPEDEEEKVSPAQLAAISRSKIYYKNLMSAMEAGAWQRALSSCESLQKALREVVGR